MCEELYSGRNFEMNLITISKAGDNEELWTDNLDFKC